MEDLALLDEIKEYKEGFADLNAEDQRHEALITAAGQPPTFVLLTSSKNIEKTIDRQSQNYCSQD